MATTDLFGNAMRWDEVNEMWILLLIEHMKKQFGRIEDLFLIDEIERHQEVDLERYKYSILIDLDQDIKGNIEPIWKELTDRDVVATGVIVCTAVKNPGPDGCPSLALRALDFRKRGYCCHSTETLWRKLKNEEFIDSILRYKRVDCQCKAELKKAVRKLINNEIFTVTDVTADATYEKSEELCCEYVITFTEKVQVIRTDGVKEVAKHGGEMGNGVSFSIAIASEIEPGIVSLFKTMWGASSGARAGFDEKHYKLGRRYLPSKEEHNRRTNRGASRAGFSAFWRGLSLILPAAADSLVGNTVGLVLPIPRYDAAGRVARAAGRAARDGYLSG